MKFIPFFLFIISTFHLVGQTDQMPSNNENASKILIAEYVSLALSQHQVPEQENLQSSSEFKMSQTLAYGHKYKFTLYHDLATSRSLYLFDTLIIDIPDEFKDVQYMVPDDLKSVARVNANEYLKHEVIFNRELSSRGNISDIEWEITNETKIINDLKCIKAISKNKEALLTVWFTLDIPTSTGPVNHFNLPGFVVWAEDFFRTTELQKVSFENYPEFNEKFALEVEKFELYDVKPQKLVDKEKQKLIKSLMAMLY